jgi:fructokinase
MAQMRIGVDLGGTKIEVAVLDDRGDFIRRERAPTPVGDYSAIVSTIAGLVQGAWRQVGGNASVGVGIPGAQSLETGLIKNANSTALNGHPLKDDLERALGCPVRLQNDANCLALSEATDVFGVIVGTGVGGGIVVHGRVLSGVNSIAGEWGHNPLTQMTDDERPGPQCYCGRLGCVESFLSGPAFATDYARCDGDRYLGHAPRVLASGRFEPAAVIIERMRAGEPQALAALERYVDRLARALSVVINILDPDAIVLGGGMSNVTELYTRVPQRWLRYVFSDSVRTRLLASRFGDSSGVRGAAWLW